MSESNPALFLIFVWVCLLQGAATRQLAKMMRRPLPYTVLLLLQGLIVGLVLFLPDRNRLGLYGQAADEASQVDPNIILQVFIPALIFDAAFGVNSHVFMREVGQALLLAGPGVLVSALLTAAFARYVFPYGWSFDEAFLFGAIMSATDPLAVTATLREVGASKRLGTLIEAESLLNDGSAFVLFVILRDSVLGNPPSASGVVETFARLTFGGIAWGGVVALVVVFWVARVFADAYVETVLTVSAAYTVFWVAEESDMKVSGVLAVVTFGLYLGKNRVAYSPTTQEPLHHFLGMISYVANTVIFVMSGVIVARGAFEDGNGTIVTEDLGYVVLLYLFLLLVRGLMIAGMFPLLRRTGYGMTVHEAVVLWWSGLRGAISLSLALLIDLEDSIPKTVKDRIVLHTVGIVALTLVINGSTVRALVHYFGMDRGNVANQLVFDQAMVHLQHEEETLMESLKQNIHFSGADWRAIRTWLPVYAKDEPSASASVLGDKRGAAAGKDDEKVIAAAEVELQRARRGADPVMSAPGVQEGEEWHEDERYKRELARLEEVQHALERRMRELREQVLLRREVKHRFLSTMRASYWKQYAHGMTTREAVSVLVEASERALDTDNIETQFAIVMRYLEVPAWVQRLDSLFAGGRWQCFGPVRSAALHLVRRWLYSSLAFGIELTTAFLTASEAVDAVVLAFPELAAMERHVVASVHREFREYEARVRTAWLDIQNSYAEVYSAIQTRQAAQFLLKAARANIEDLFTDGLLEQQENDRMVAVVERSMARLHLGGGLRVGFAPSDDVIMELPFLSPLTEAERRQVIKRCQQRIFQRGEALVRAGERLDGLFVITRGVVELRGAESDGDGEGAQLDLLAVGRLVGAYSALSGKVYLANANAQGLVEAFYFSSSVLHDVLRANVTVERQLWKMAGASLARAFFSSAFGDVGDVQIVSITMDSFFVRCNRTEHQVFELHGVAMLLTGVVESLPLGWRRRPSRRTKPRRGGRPRLRVDVGLGAQAGGPSASSGSERDTDESSAAGDASAMVRGDSAPGLDSMLSPPSVPSAAEAEEAARQLPMASLSSLPPSESPTLSGDEESASARQQYSRAGRQSMVIKVAQNLDGGAAGHEVMMGVGDGDGDDEGKRDDDDDDDDDESTNKDGVGHHSVTGVGVSAPAILYPSARVLKYRFSPGARLLVFRSSAALADGAPRAAGPMRDASQLSGLERVTAAAAAAVSAPGSSPVGARRALRRHGSPGGAGAAGAARSPVAGGAVPTRTFSFYNGALLSPRAVASASSSPRHRRNRTFAASDSAPPAASRASAVTPGPQRRVRSVDRPASRRRSMSDVDPSVLALFAPEKSKVMNEHVAVRLQAAALDQRRAGAGGTLPMQRAVSDGAGARRVHAAVSGKFHRMERAARDAAASRPAGLSAAAAKRPSSPSVASGDDSAASGLEV